MKYKQWVRKWCYGSPFRYRFDPVPFIRCYKNSIRHYYRRVKTTQERRWSLVDTKYIRSKRNFRNLPNPWNDYNIADNKQRGWKRTKKKRQWI